MNEIKVAKIKFNDGAFRELEEKGLLLLETVAENVKMTAKTIVQVDTGNLKDSIKVSDGNTKYEKYIGSDVPYAIFQELGTVRMPPHSYLRPSLEYIINELNTTRGG